MENIDIKQPQASPVNDIMRLAGIQNIFKPDLTVNHEQSANVNSIKYILLAVIEKYNNASDRSNTPNARALYSEIINKLDSIIGYINSNNNDAAKQAYDSLDSNVKNSILTFDTNDQLASFFKSPDDTQSTAVVVTTTPTSVEVCDKDDNSCDKEEKAEDEAKESTKEEDDEQEKKEKSLVKKKDTVSESVKIEKEDKVTVPTKVINDLKMAIKELNDGHNFDYVSHLSGVEQKSSKQAYHQEILETLLGYFTTPHKESVNNATTYIMTLDTEAKQQIPLTVWEYLIKAKDPKDKDDEYYKAIK
jgi:hypothetical protein